MQFENVVGQQTAKERLHSLLILFNTQFIILSGPSGIGKKTMARELVRLILCPRAAAHEAATADDCAVCRYLEAGSHPDFVSLFPDQPGKVIPVERVRREIVDDTVTRPQLGERKVYLIDGDGLNEQGQNAMLKTFEEPPPYCSFVLLSGEPRRLLDTIRSRAALVPLSRSTPDEIREILKLHLIAENEATDYIIRYADGVPGVALDLCRDEWYVEAKSSMIKIIDLLTRSDRSQLLVNGFSIFEENKERINDFLDLLETWFRDLYVWSRTHRVEQLIHRDQIDRIAEFSERRRWTTQTDVRIFRLIGEVRQALAANGNFEMSVNYLLLQLRKELN